MYNVVKFQIDLIRERGNIRDLPGTISLNEIGPEQYLQSASTKLKPSDYHHCVWATVPSFLLVKQVTPSI